MYSLTTYFTLYWRSSQCHMVRKKERDLNWKKGNNTELFIEDTYLQQTKQQTNKITKTKTKLKRKPKNKETQ